LAHLEEVMSAHRARARSAPLRLLLATALGIAGLAVAATAQPADAGVSGAVSTTTSVTNPATAGHGACLNGPSGNATGGYQDVVNCNQYSKKDDVWTTGLPKPAFVEDGTYFFAVVSPGGQPDPNDGSPTLLSTDAQSNRTFTVSNGNVSYSGTHGFENGKLQLAPYDDTPNPGGVYILAVCQVTGDDTTVTPSACKYDAFKVKESETPDPGGNNADPLTITKDATGTYTTTYGWGITKQVDKTLVKQVGGSAVFNYTVGATRSAGTVSDVHVAGSITVTNPNASDVTATVTDVLSDGTACTVTAGTTMHSGDNVFPYTCDLASVPQAQLDNTASVTWDDQSLGADGQLTGDFADFTFEGIEFASNDVDACTTVTDTFGLHGTTGGTTTLGTTCESKTFTYPRTVAIPAYGCLTYDNTATYTKNTSGGTGSASQSVTVCGPVKTGALTMGFWQNKNGQGIITGQAKTGPCPSATWLRTYAPFQDLSATATCAQVAAYDTDLFKKASAAGATMNAMLKAQMLATAFDVYFSDPALGGNKIGAPAPVGGVAIDLTQVCKDIAACTTFENTSSAFGGATSLTVSQVLAYAGSKSNAGGSVWYGQVKATQGLAKDTFDAINNQVAFAP
jgi:hypothetical protein